MLCLRNVFVTYKDGGNGIFNKDYALEWNKRIGLVNSIAQTGNFSLLNNYKVDYIYSESYLNITYPLVFDREKSKIYDLSS